ncbi:GNAT family N-acetyltransferase [Angustibacter aerolatus]|uniref:Histone acetyltransferase n=1 Tax=Angustibacter aerolatus TaxID=1162965 RepID=A0ABQ6JFY1_9ACTN|nr:histone acetyltransferase [Angustibacter aerolatus]
MQIRRAVEGDAEALAEVHHRSRESAGGLIPPAVHPVEALHRFTRDVVVPHREAYLAEDHDGTALGTLVLDGDDVDWLYVAPEAQGRGVGRALLEHAKSLRPNGLALWAFASNHPARTFYERHGFVAVRETDGDNEEGAPDVRYVWGGHPEATDPATGASGHR